MAVSNSLTSHVYRDGKRSFNSRSDEIQIAGTAEQCWSWLTRVQLQRIVALAYATAQQSCIPDDGRPFFDEGVAYASSDAFLDSLIEELRALLHFRFGSHLPGENFGMLSDLRAARVACGRADERVEL